MSRASLPVRSPWLIPGDKLWNYHNFRSRPSRCPVCVELRFPEHMITIENLLKIICTEAFEYDGIPEVPDHKHGDRHNYSAPKREARDKRKSDTRSHSANLTTLQYDLELVQDEDGVLRWHE